MRQFVTILLVIGLLVAVSNPATAFDFEEELQKLAEKNAVGYLGPMPTAFGMAMNSGLYHSANTHRFLPIPGFDIMLKFSLVQVADEDLTYNFYVGDEFAIDVSGMGLGVNELILNPETIYPDRETPTVFGESEAVDIMPTGADDALTTALLNAGVTQPQIDLLHASGQFAQLTSQIPTVPTIPGSGVDLMPLVMPQLTFGLPMHSELALRYIPPTAAGEFGDVSLMGFGLKHEISQYIPLPGMFKPDIAVQYMWQKLEVGDIIASTHTAMNVHASYGINLIILKIEPYVGFGAETSNLEVDYVVDAPGTSFHGQNVAFDLDGNNKSRMTGGVKLGIVIPFLRVTADYSIGEYTAATLGIGLSF